MRDTLHNLLWGVVTGLLMVVSLSYGVLYGSKQKAEEVVEAYERGKKDALKVSPRPSMELEMTCINIWANKVPLPEVLK